MSLEQINNENYTYEVSLYRMEDDGTLSTADALSYDFISELKIENEITRPLPSLTLFYKDPNFEISPKYSIDGRTFMSVNISYTTNEGQDVPKTTYLFSHVFLINDIQTVPDTKTSDTATFKFFGISELAISWLSKVYYSTAGKEKEITKIINDMFKASSLKKRFELLVSDQNEKVLQSSNDTNNFNHCRDKANYITPVNSTLWDNIFALLIAANNDTTGLYCTTFNIIEDKFYLISAKSIFTDTVVLPYNDSMLGSQYGFDTTEKLAKSDLNYNFIRGIHHYDRASKNTINYFDYNDRKWSKDVFEKKRLRKFLPSTNQKILGGYWDDLLKDISDLYQNNNTFNIESVSNFPFNLKQQMDEFFKYAQVKQLTLTGFLPRDAGQLFFLRAASKDSFRSRDEGIWLISRIEHVFSKGQYDQNLSLIRSDKLLETFEPQALT